MGFETRAKGRERWSRGDVTWKTVPQISGRNRKHSVADGFIMPSLLGTGLGMQCYKSL